MTINKTITELNPQIRKWIGSDQVIVVIGELNKKYGVSAKKLSVIPRLVLHITLKVAEPQNFTQMLAEELNVSQAAAVAIADEVQEKIFLPVRKQLFDDDIDINLIKTTLPGAGIDHKPAIEYKKPELAVKPPAAQAEKTERVPQVAEQVPAAPTKEMAAIPPREEITPKPLESVVAAPLSATWSEPAVAAVKPPAAGAAGGGEPAPFVLHQEKESGFQPILETRKVAFAPAPTGEIKKAARPIAARLEIGEEAAAPVMSKSEPPQQRVVHYSEFRTPVSPFGAAQNQPFGVTPGQFSGEAKPAGGETPSASAPLLAQPLLRPDGSGGQAAEKQPLPKTPAPKNEEVVDLAAFRKDQKVAVNKNTVDLR